MSGIIFPRVKHSNQEILTHIGVYKECFTVHSVWHSWHISLTSSHLNIQPTICGDVQKQKQVFLQGVLQPTTAKTIITHIKLSQKLAYRHISWRIKQDKSLVVKSLRHRRPHLRPCSCVCNPVKKLSVALVTKTTQW